MLKNRDRGRKDIVASFSFSPFYSPSFRTSLPSPWKIKKSWQWRPGSSRGVSAFLWLRAKEQRRKRKREGINKEGAEDRTLGVRISFHRQQLLKLHPIFLQLLQSRVCKPWASGDRIWQREINSQISDAGVIRLMRRGWGQLWEACKKTYIMHGTQSRIHALSILSIHVYKYNIAGVFSPSK